MGGGLLDMGGSAFVMGGFMGGGLLDMRGGASVMGGLMGGRQLDWRGGVAHGGGTGRVFASVSPSSPASRAPGRSSGRGRKVTVKNRSAVKVGSGQPWRSASSRMRRIPVPAFSM